MVSEIEWSPGGETNKWMIKYQLHERVFGPILCGDQPKEGWARSQRSRKKRSQGQALLPALGNWWTLDLGRFFELFKFHCKSWDENNWHQLTGCARAWKDLGFKVGPGVSSEFHLMARFLDLSVCIVLKWKHLERYLMMFVKDFTQIKSRKENEKCWEASPGWPDRFLSSSPPWTGSWLHSSQTRGSWWTWTSPKPNAMIIWTR